MHSPVVIACSLTALTAVPAAQAAETGRQSAALQRSCEAGKTADCVTLGRFLRDAGATAKVMQKACRAGDPVGCGLLYWASDAVPTDLARAGAELKKACDAGRAIGCIFLAEMRAEDQGVPRDARPSEALYKKAADLLAPACNAGDGVACLDLAELHLNGRGVAANAERVTALYAKGCQAGFAPACQAAALDEMGAKPVAREISVEEFIGPLESACQAGADWGCIQIARLYKEGQVVPKDPARAAAYFRKTAEILQRQCDAGKTDACKAAGELYEKEGVPRKGSAPR